MVVGNPVGAGMSETVGTTPSSASRASGEVVEQPAMRLSYCTLSLVFGIIYHMLSTSPRSRS